MPLKTQLLLVNHFKVFNLLPFSTLCQRTMCLCASNNCNKPDLSPAEPGPAVQGIRQLQAWIAENFNISLKNPN